MSSSGASSSEVNPPVVRDDAYFAEIRHAVGRTTPTVLLGTSKRSVDRAMRVLKVEYGNQPGDDPEYRQTTARRSRVRKAASSFGVAVVAACVGLLIWGVVEAGSAALRALLFAAVGGVAVVIVITIVVVIGIHREERYLTLANRHPPGAVALLARLVLGRYVRRETSDQDEHKGHKYDSGHVAADNEHEDRN